MKLLNSQSVSVSLDNLHNTSTLKLMQPKAIHALQTVLFTPVLLLLLPRQNAFGGKVHQLAMKSLNWEAKIQFNRKINWSVQWVTVYRCTRHQQLKGNSKLNHTGQKTAATLYLIKLSSITPISDVTACVLLFYSWWMMRHYWLGRDQMFSQYSLERLHLYIKSQIPGLDQKIQ